MSHITELKKAEDQERQILASYLGHVGTINNDPRPKANKNPQPFFGSKVMGKELDGLSAVSARLRRHLSGELVLTDDEKQRLAVNGYEYFKNNRFERKEITLQNGDKLIRNIQRW